MSCPVHATHHVHFRSCVNRTGPIKTWRALIRPMCSKLHRQEASFERLGPCNLEGFTQVRHKRSTTHSCSRAHFYSMETRCDKLTFV